jgi:mRNA-degrading endonuclease RelE of RelBE toxin-antitoxin system
MSNLEIGIIKPEFRKKLKILSKKEFNQVMDKIDLLDRTPLQKCMNK